MKKRNSNLIQAENFILLLVTAFFQITTLPSHAQDFQLKRRVVHGIRMINLNNQIKNQYSYPETTGIVIQQVIPDYTAWDAGIKINDIIYSINEQPILSPTDLSEKPINELTEGTSVNYKVWRDNNWLTLNAKGRAKPKERSVDIVYTYQTIETASGKLQSIISNSKEAKKENKPAILFIQGSTCASIVDIDTLDVYKQLTDGLTRMGFMVMRIDKPGVGDSEKKRKCEEIDFGEHVMLYESAVLKLQSLGNKNIYLLGHSFGASVALALAAKNSTIKGIITYGGLTNSWGEYLTEITRLNLTQNGVNATQVEIMTKKMQDVLHEILIKGQNPETIKKSDEMASVVVERILGWSSEKEYLNGHSLAFNKTFNEFKPNESWNILNCNALILHGENDFEAINTEYSKRPLEWNNMQKRRDFIIIGNADHSFAEVTNMEEGIKLKRSSEYISYMKRNFSKNIVKVISSWIMDQK